ncbi:MAG TPA: hypothetical protein ENI07_15970 [Desulfobacterales bacterium]|nr:hypothetical protein [Desulfobacterales bacterium]
MSEPEIKTEPVKETTVTDPAPVGDKPESIPYDRFKAVNDEKKALAEQVTEMKTEQDKTKADQEKIRKAQLEKQGEYKTLLEEANASLETVTSERDTAVLYRTDHEAKRREAINSTKGLTEEDKVAAEDMPIDAAENFITRLYHTEIKPGTDTRPANSRTNVDLKSIAEMSDKERRETHEQRLAQYR